MTPFNIGETARRIADTTMPSQAGYGLVFETWQRDWDNAMRRAVRETVPAEHQDAVLAKLVDAFYMTDPNEPSILDEPGTCSCGLDAMTCPNGHFEDEGDLDFDWGDSSEMLAHLDESEAWSSAQA